jgi:5,10-methylenetetrahydromethanopterin reductase
VIRISCDLMPSPRIVDEARLAEELGYTRVYVGDSPALFGDIWVALARIAEHTSAIGLGTGVLVPFSRHPVVNAAAIATIESISPGRLVVAVGSGNTARRVLGHRLPSKLAWMRDYIQVLRGLLRGETMDWEGKRIALVPYPGDMPPFPIEVPFLLNVRGPKGLATARECADGVMGSVAPEFPVNIPLVSGTILDDGEDLTAERAVLAHGPMVLPMLHNFYEDDRERLTAIPGAALWRTRIDALARPGEAHLLVHQGHCAQVAPHDADVIRDPGFLAFTRKLRMTMTGTRDEAAAKISGLIEAGASEILYLPAGPDVPRELRAFAAAARLAESVSSGA